MTGEGKSMTGQPTQISPARVTRVVEKLLATTREQAEQNWLRAVADRVVRERPDLSQELLHVLGLTSPSSALPEEEATGEVLLAGLSIGELGVCYEALVSAVDKGSRRASGQFFTPDDVARFMVERTTSFPAGVWLDPSCGVGNLSWHLVAAQDRPHDFIKDSLLLVDRDGTALRSAVALISAEFAASGDRAAVRGLSANAIHRDFLSAPPLPNYDYALLNPPYAQAPPLRGYETGRARDLFAFFLERVAKTARGFVAVTPASYLSAPKFGELRSVLNREASAGDVYVFDNVPDTLFRGYKFGSTNTSKTNFVRAAITVVPPEVGSPSAVASGWRVTPILRWQTGSRQDLFTHSPALLTGRRLGPDQEWVKLLPSLADVWDEVSSASQVLSDLLCSEETPFRLDVALTPRYYISASFTPLQRSSKATLFFASAADQQRAAVVLNSSWAYLWWRGLDGGVTLPKRVLHSLPLPNVPGPPSTLIEELQRSEQENRVTKRNAGKVNENVKHPTHLVQKLNRLVLPNVCEQSLQLVYSNNMFADPAALIAPCPN